MIICGWFGAFLFQPLSSYGQSKTLIFDRLSITDGLPSQSVLDLIQDDRGFIWASTPTGNIIRYDGYEILTYQLKIGNSDSLSVRDYPRLFQDKPGEIWVGLDVGFGPQKVKLYRYEPSLDDFVPFLYDPNQETYPIQDGVIALGEDSLGRLLVGTGGMGLYVIDKSNLSAGKVLHHFRHIPGNPNSLPNDDIRSPIVTDANGLTWIPTLDGLCKFTPEDGQFQTFQFAPGSVQNKNICWTIHLDKAQQNIWVGTNKSGLWQFDLEEETFIKQFQLDPKDRFNTPGNSVFGITKDQRNRLWLVTSAVTDLGNYLYILNPESEQFTPIQSQYRLKSTPHFAAINSLLTDRTGNIWLGTWQNGIFRTNLDREAVQVVQIPQKLLLRPNELDIHHLYQGRRDLLWIGTNQGLFRWHSRQNTFQSYRMGLDQADINLEIWEITEFTNGHLLLKTPQEFLLYDPTTELAKTYSGIPHSRHFMFHRREDGPLWLLYSKQNQVCRLANEASGQMDCQDAGEKIDLNFINCAVEDNSGNIWIGVNQDGLVRFNPEANDFEQFITQYSVYDIQFDQKGRCWLATHSAGLQRFDPETKKINHLDDTQNKLIGHARSIEMDDKGYLWVYASGGLFQFDPDSHQLRQRLKLEALHVKTNTWRGKLTYNRPNGFLYLHTIDQILRFRPDNLREDSIPPTVVFTRFRVFTEEIEPGPDSPLSLDISRTKSIRLSSHQNDFTVSYAGLHFKSPAENRYRYRLDRYDQNWQEVGNQRNARYTNLRPGKYTFRVQAANSDGFWTDESEEAKLFITIPPPWYANPLAYSLYVLLFLILLYVGYQFLLQQKLAEEKAQRLLELDQFKSRFYTNITHEFRTPLTLILGAAEQLPSDSNPEIHKRQSLIRRQGRQLLNLINQLLDLSKLESDSLPLQEIQADVIPFIKGVVASFESAAAQKGLDLKLYFAIDHLVMDFDPEKLQMILTNLLSNAVKFTPSGGDVYLMVGGRRQTVGGRSAIFHNSSLIIKVNDTGPGIAPEHLPHIFDRFYQVDSSATREGEGTGIGLALTKELVNLIGGQIDVESSLGQGTEFTVSLLVRQTATQKSVQISKKIDVFEHKVPGQNPPLFPDQKSLDRPLLLVAEDNPDMSNFMKELLEDQYRVQLAANGEIGLQIAIELVPDLVISDVMMPKMDGFELCRKLKQDERTSHIPVVLLTAKVGQEHRIEGLQFGADAYLAKPFDKKELKVRVEQLIALRNKLQERYRQITDLHDDSMPGQSQEAAFLKKIQQIIKENLSDLDLNVAKLCKLAGMSRTQLFNKIKALTGISTSRFIRSVRLDQARQLLLSTTLSITEIAFKVGFKDSNFFSTCFREAYGVSPRKFRSKD